MKDAGVVEEDILTESAFVVWLFGLGGIGIAVW